MIINQKQYELSFILKPALKDAEISGWVENLKSKIRELEGMIDKEERPTKIRLAYLVDKQAYGYFGLIIFSISPDKLKNIEKEFKFDKKLLRYLMIYNPQLKIKERPTKASKIKQPQIQKEEKVEKIQMEELDKKLEEILQGKT